MALDGSNQILITLPEMHPRQLDIYQDTHRFRVVPKGRRFGGSLLGSIEAIAEMLKGGNCWYVAPTAGNALDRWEELKALARQIDGTVIREEPRTITYQGVGMLAVKSAQSYDNLRGSGLTLIIADEFAFWDKAAYIWRQILRPMLARAKGRALFLSSPNGLNDFKKLADYGDDPLRPAWITLPRKTSDNPLIDPDEIAEMRAEMTELEAQQELDALFVDMTGTVFRKVNQTAVLQATAVENHKYIVGVDLAKSKDYTVFAVIDATLRQLVHLDRQPHSDYGLQVKRLKALCDKFNPDSVIVEENNIGTVVLEMARKAGIPHLQALTTTNTSKAEWVEALTIDFENDRFSVIPDPVLISEFGTFIAGKLPSGLMKYAASGPNHDDTVMALLLGHSGLNKSRRTHGGFGGSGIPAEAMSEPPKPRVGQWFDGIFIERDGE